jgi:hypothetical protein
MARFGSQAVRSGAGDGPESWNLAGVPGVSRKRGLQRRRCCAVAAKKRETALEIEVQAGVCCKKIVSQM